MTEMLNRGRLKRGSDGLRDTLNAQIAAMACAIEKQGKTVEPKGPTSEYADRKRTELLWPPDMPEFRASLILPGLVDPDGKPNSDCEILCVSNVEEHRDKGLDASYTNVAPGVSINANGDILAIVPVCQAGTSDYGDIILNGKWDYLTPPEKRGIVSYLGHCVSYLNDPGGRPPEECVTA